MEIKKAFKFRLRPSRKHRIRMAQTAGCVRLVWNKALAAEKELLESKKGVLNYSGLCKEITSWKKEESSSFLNEAASQPLQQTAKDLDRALKDAFKKAKGFPRFKKKGQDDSFRYPQGFKIEEDRIFLPKIGWVKFRNSRPIDGTPKNVKESKNREKQKWKIQRLHKAIADSRLDYLHKATNWIAKNHGKVILEDLKVANMSKSAKGDMQNPGKNVAAKSGLNKSILDQGWFEFKRQLTYKLEWLGGELIIVDAKYTSQKCNVCGFCSKANRKTQAKFVCVCCGHVDHADQNAALNILAAGHAVSACGDISSITS